jgi:polyhydroxyalkanoate synthesis regulator phasin
MSQREEMETLRNEVTRLEIQLDTLNEDLDRKLQEYESCNGGG